MPFLHTSRRPFLAPWLLLAGFPLACNTGCTSVIGTAYLRDSDIQNFIPRTANVQLSWDYRKLGATASWNYTSESIRTAYNTAAPSRNQYLEARDIFNASIRYQLPRNQTLSVGVANLFNAPQRYYRGVRDQLETLLIQGTTMTVSVEGRF